MQGIVGASLRVCIPSGGEPARVHTQYSSSGLETKQAIVNPTTLTMAPQYYSEVSLSQELLSIGLVSVGTVESPL